MTMSNLKNQKYKAQNELYTLHIQESNPEMYKLRRDELEWEIVCIENAIASKQQMKPFKNVLILFIVTVIVMTGLFIFFN